MSKQMKWTASRAYGDATWASDAGYKVRFVARGLAPYRVVAPGIVTYQGTGSLTFVAARPIGGSSTLQGAQEMANDHASGDFVKRRLARTKGENK